MAFDRSAWIEMQLAMIRQHTSGYNSREAAKASLKFLTGAIERLSPGVDEQQFEILREKTERLVALLPQKNGVGKLELDIYLKALKSFEAYVRETFKLVPTGHYTNLWIVLGITLGVTMGLLWNNTASGISVGVLLGLAYGHYLDKRAAEAGRSL